VAREKWIVEPPFVDRAHGFFFSANSLEELAANIKMKYQRVPMLAARLVAQVARYNSFVERGEDLDFAKPAPKYRIATPPFYAAWATPVPHDTRVGLRINADCQVIDMQGAVIPGLYCGGESAGGFSRPQGGGGDGIGRKRAERAGGAVSDAGSVSWPPRRSPTPSLRANLSGRRPAR
jgi:hypothetical protein